MLVLLLLQCVLVLGGVVRREDEAWDGFAEIGSMGHLSVGLESDAEGEELESQPKRKRGQSNPVREVSPDAFVQVDDNVTGLPKWMHRDSTWVSSDDYGALSDEWDEANEKRTTYVEVVASPSKVLTKTKKSDGVIRKMFGCWIEGSESDWKSMKAHVVGGGRYQPGSVDNPYSTFQSYLKDVCYPDSSRNYEVNIIRDDSNKGSDYTSPNYGFAVWEGSSMHVAAISRPRILQMDPSKDVRNAFRSSWFGKGDVTPHFSSFDVDEKTGFCNSYIMFYAAYYINGEIAGYIGWREWNNKKPT